MTFLWTTKNADSIDVPNFDNHSDFHVEENKSSHGNKSRHGKRRVSTILKQIDAKAAKRGSGVSVASSSICDEVSVLSLHSAFLTNNLPIKEDTEFTTPSMVNHDNGNRSQSLIINPNGSSRSLGVNIRRSSSSHLKTSQHPSFSTMTFSDKSLPISQEDIESIEQSWIDNQQDDQNSIRSSGRTSPQRSTSRRRFSTQTYSEKGTVYSSIYKNYCDEESARSVASNSFNAANNSQLSDLHGYRGTCNDPGKQQTYNSYLQSGSTVGSARLCRDGSTRSTFHTSTSNGQSQYEDVSLHPQTAVPNSTPTTVLSTKRTETNEALISNAVNKIHARSTASKKNKIRSQKQSNSENSVMSTVSSTSKKNSSNKQSSSSSTKTDDNTLLIKNHRSSGKPPLSTKPLSKSSSSSSLTDDTTESRVQKELYRLSLELASTLSNLDFKKLEVTKYMKQVDELEAIITKLVLEKEQLESKLERYETNERIHKQRKGKNRSDHSDFISKQSSKKKAKKNKNGIEIEIEGVIQTENILVEPNCVTPTSGDDDDNDSASQLNDENKMDESEILFPDLNESHLTCQDLYATMEEDDDNNGANDNFSTHDNTTSESLNEDNDSFVNDDGEENDDEFPTEILDTTVSLIDPREEIFDDDPFATVYDYGKRLKTQNELSNEEHSINDNRSVISLQWIPFMNKDSRKKIDETKHGKRFLNDKQAREKYSDLNTSFRSTKTNMTAPVKKSNFFGFSF